jgi:molecular chaperone GrpE (heat shock protein)
MSKKKCKQKTMGLKGNRVLKAFNIHIPDEVGFPIRGDVTGLHAIIDENHQLKAQMAKMHKASEVSHKPQIKTPQFDDLKALASIATNAWRAQNKMVDSDTGEAKEEMKRVYRHIEGIIESLTQSGIQIIDPVGRAYDSGMALNVVSFEPTSGLTSEEIKETIKPSVALHGRLIQMGEVIVGTPEKA